MVPPVAPMADPNTFQLSHEDVGPRVRILAVRGEADRFSTDAVDAAVEDARTAGRGVIVDLSDATYLDSSMLATLVVASEEGRRRAQPLVILCATPRLRRSLELKGLQSILRVTDSREQAVALVESSPRGDEPASERG